MKLKSVISNRNMAFILQFAGSQSIQCVMLVLLQVFLFALPSLLKSEVLNLVCLGAGSVCLLCVLVFDCGAGGSKEVYKRQEAEQKSESRWD